VPSFDAHLTPCVQIGWRLAARYWRAGLATEAARECPRFAFEALGLREGVCFTVPANLRSRAVMGRIGLRRDAAGDLPRSAAGERARLSQHVLFRLSRERWEDSQSA
jgi:ribosomal-protein-alanine N-acetyltransferase